MAKAMKRKKKGKRGAPTLYPPPDAKRQYRGFLSTHPFASWAQIAAHFGISTQTLAKWRNEYDWLEHERELTRARVLQGVDNAMVGAAIEDRNVGAAQLVYRRGGGIDSQGNAPDGNAAQPHTTVQINIVEPDPLKQREIEVIQQRVRQEVRQVGFATEDPEVIEPENKGTLRPGSSFLKDFTKEEQDP